MAALKHAPLWQKALMLAVPIVVVAVLMLVGLARPRSVLKLAAVQEGGLRSEVTASGSLQARNTVEVGTQVSGTIARLYADYNSRVRKGQLIALLDTTLLKASVLDAQASYEKAQAQLILAENARKRSEALYQQQLISELDWNSAQADHQSAVSAATSARAQMERARINLSYAYIRSPMDGVVISRSVEVGQTVASSLNAPTLFVIADDLSRMQVSATVDEGDIGKVKVGQRVEFTVDAYPDETFEGTVAKIYLLPVTVQNVVSYTAIVDIANPGMKLLPGMTANITVVTQSVDDALLVPAAALKFQPPLDRPRGGSRPDSAHSRQNGAAPGQRTEDGRQSSGGRWSDGSASGQRSGAGGRTRVFVARKGKLQRVPVQVLLDNGVTAAVSGDLSAGDSVAVGYLNNNGKAKAAARNPFQPQRPGGRRR